MEPLLVVMRLSGMAALIDKMPAKVQKLCLAGIVK
jgi:hypothetical protein